MPSLMRDAVSVTKFGLAICADVLRAIRELGIARFRMGVHSSKDLITLAQEQGQPNSRKLSSDEIAQLVERVRYTIPRVAARLPWRADCFVQALAAKHWLHHRGVPTCLCIGVRKDRPDAFEAHAWLKHGDVIVTGGDIAGYVPIVAPGIRSRGGPNCTDLQL